MRGSKDKKEVNPRYDMSLRKQRGIINAMVTQAVRAAKLAPAVA